MENNWLNIGNSFPQLDSPKSEELNNNVVKKMITEAELQNAVKQLH